MKTASAFFLFLFAASYLQAQFIKAGPKIGVNMVKVGGQSFKDGFQVGYYAGGFAEIKLKKNLYVQTDVLFAENNLHTTSDFHSIYQDLLKLDTLKTIRLQALSLPVSLNWKVANVLSLGAGVQFTANMKKGDGLLRNAEHAITKGDVAAMAGATVLLKSFRISGRYLLGLTDMNNIDGKEAWRQQTFQLGVGFVL
jgi:hypothetical protein